MGWRYRVGLFLIATVVIIWVTSAEVTQGIFKDYKLPFALTYLGASLMVVYLPLAFIKDWFYNLNAALLKVVKMQNDFSVRICSPLKGNGVEKNLNWKWGVRFVKMVI